MSIKSTIGSVCSRVKSVTRQTMLLGVGITAVVIENVRDNAVPYSEKLVERGQQTAQTINEAYDQRRSAIRDRARSNGHVKEAAK
ncbi:MAG: hypothetical protein IPM39_00700 [Chloroflexi bacterium]|nr:hypothetical protein [Chloroflexota bacterium]